MAWINDRVTKKRKVIIAQGHAHELTFSCYRRSPFLDSDRTRLWLAESIDNARRVNTFDLHAWVFMPEHVHLLIRPRGKDYRIADILKSIKQPVSRRAVAFLRRIDSPLLAKIRIARSDGRLEHRFWQSGGGYDRNIYEPKTLLASIQYIHANPVRGVSPRSRPIGRGRAPAGSRAIETACCSATRSRRHSPELNCVNERVELTASLHHRHGQVQSDLPVPPHRSAGCYWKHAGQPPATT